MKITKRNIRRLIREELRRALLEQTTDELDQLPPGGQCVTDLHPAVVALKNNLANAGIEDMLDTQKLGVDLPEGDWQGEPLMVIDVSDEAIKNSDVGNMSGIRAIGTIVQRKYPDVNFGWESLGVFGEQMLYIYGAFVDDENQDFLEPWQDLTRGNQRDLRKAYGC